MAPFGVFGVSAFLLSARRPVDQGRFQLLPVLVDVPAIVGRPDTGLWISMSGVSERGQELKASLIHRPATGHRQPVSVGSFALSQPEMPSGMT